MKKRLNRFALTLWLLALIVFVFDAASSFLIPPALTQLATMGTHWGGQATFYVVWHLRRALFDDVSTVATFAGLGAIIELLDQVRWNALQRAK